MMGDITMTSYFTLIPELYLAGWALVFLLFCVYRLPRANSYLLIAGALVLTMTAALTCAGYNDKITVLNGMFISDRFAVMAKCLILAGSALALLLSSGWVKEGRPFEFVVLVMLSTLGMLLLVSANDLLTLYMALEMMSLALYVLASFSRDHAKSSEAGLKYFMLGALASGMMLFGMSLVYGFAGTTSFAGLATLFAPEHLVLSKGIVVGLILIIVGFCFKVSAAPFHMWSPDVYEGAPTPVTAFFATAPKVAAFAIFARLLMQPFGHLVDQWQQIIIFVSVASMLVGALAAIMQTSIKRLLAYSSIGHAGFILMGLAAGGQAGVQGMLIYLVTYIFMSAGAFGCVLMMRRDGHYVETIKDLSGLAQTNPLHALMLSVFMFSMAGIPPLAGFFGKMYVIIAAIDAGLVWLAVVGVATSVIGGFYYIKVVKVMYFDEAAPAFDAQPSRLLGAALFICTIFTLLFFLVPTPLVTQAGLAAQALLK